MMFFSKFFNRYIFYNLVELQVPKYLQLNFLISFLFRWITYGLNLIILGFFLCVMLMYIIWFSHFSIWFFYLIFLYCLSYIPNGYKYIDEIFRLKKIIVLTFTFLKEFFFFFFFLKLKFLVIIKNFMLDFLHGELFYQFNWYIYILWFLWLLCVWKFWEIFYSFMKTLLLYEIVFYIKEKFRKSSLKKFFFLSKKIKKFWWLFIDEEQSHLPDDDFILKHKNALKTKWFLIKKKIIYLKYFVIFTRTVYTRRFKWLKFFFWWINNFYLKFFLFFFKIYKKNNFWTTFKRNLFTETVPLTTKFDTTKFHFVSCVKNDLYKSYFINAINYSKIFKSKEKNLTFKYSMLQMLEHYFYFYKLYQIILKIFRGEFFFPFELSFLIKKNIWYKIIYLMLSVGFVVIFFVNIIQLLDFSSFLFKIQNWIAVHYSKRGKRLSFLTRKKWYLHNLKIIREIIFWKNLINYLDNIFFIKKKNITIAYKIFFCQKWLILNNFHYLKFFKKIFLIYSNKIFFIEENYIFFFFILFYFFEFWILFLIQYFGWILLNNYFSVTTELYGNWNLYFIYFWLQTFTTTLCSKILKLKFLNIILIYSIFTLKFLKLFVKNLLCLY